MIVERPGREPDVHDDALVLVVVGVEDQRLKWRGRVALRRRDALDDRLEQRGHAGALLGRDEEDLLARDREGVLELVHDQLGVGRWQIDLVEDRDDRQALAEREMDVREGLGLDALRRIDHEDRALARLEAVADLVAEVDVPGRVDEVEPVDQAVLRRVLEADGAGLDRDPLLALEVHRVEHLARHLARVDGVRQLEQSIGERRLAVVDVGDDREVAEPALRDGHEAAV